MGKSPRGLLVVSIRLGGNVTVGRMIEFGFFQPTLLIPVPSLGSVDLLSCTEKGQEFLFAHRQPRLLWMGRARLHSDYGRINVNKLYLRPIHP